MADNTPSPTPSEDNRKNERDDLTRSALDHVMTNPTQSYDDFVGTFTFLKNNKPELVPSLQERAKHKKPSIEPSDHTATSQPPSTTETGPVKSTRNIVNDIKRRRLGKIITGRNTQTYTAEELETEVLEEGETTSRLAGQNVIKTGSIKVDNFVEADEDVEEITPEYTASFASGRSQTAGSKLRAQRSPQESRIPDMSDSIMAQLSLGESDTDKLLLNFLADLQNEMNSNSSDRINNASQETHIIQSTQNDVQISENSNRSNSTFTNPEQAKAENKIKEKPASSDENSAGCCTTKDNRAEVNENEENYQEDVDFDDEDCDNALGLCDDRGTDNLAIKIRPGELEKVAENEMSEQERRKATLSEIYKNALMDSEGNIRTTVAERMTQVDQFGSTNESAERAVVFPGEVEETDSFPVYENNTLLDFKATYRDGSEPDNNSDKVPTCDEVEPFQLDENFDYDNVVLTPKFSAGDLNILQQLRAQAVAL